MKTLLIAWICTAISLLIVSFLLPGFTVTGIWPAFIAALVIGLVNGTLGFVLQILSLPITILTLGLFSLIINALMIMLAARLVDGFAVSGFWAAFFGSIALSIVNAIVGSMLKPDGK